ncbi:inositol monophosphatase family protein [Virgibacillus senegalensis]|uniref:inositol monophosphatase family protein n=1 Tax=Virgibacillus senegalensis TaxID=1499679 RepID=UPI00069F0169|nr:inositol monophosphatase family protein [Virgibacillus senegalensis]
MELEARQKLFETAKQWILEAGENIRAVINEPLKIDTKSNANDLVTHMDQQTEQFFIDKIRKQFPDHSILSEEGYGDQLESDKGVVWIIDPIDGTMNFVHQKRNFAISIGIYQDGIGEIGLIYNVMDDVLYAAQRGNGAYRNEEKLQPLKQELPLEEAILILNNFWTGPNLKIEETKMQALVRKVRGTRSYGSAALELAYVAEGIADGYLTMKLAPWDIAGGLVLVSEVGGMTTRADGSPIHILEENTLLSCNPKIQQELVREYIELK